MRWSRKTHRNPGTGRQGGTQSPVAAVPTVPESEFRRMGEAWDRAIDNGLMDEGAETKYHCAPDGKLLSIAVGKTGQILVNGEQLTPRVANRLRGEMPFLAQLVTLYEQNQAAQLQRRMDEVATDGVSLLRQPSGPDPLLRVVPAAVHLWVQKTVSPGSRPGGEPG
ncbi:hypothetical protein [Streptomyces sioyaensis]|uniref:hypothetical protein n=1 Tax=Streptomyces sioyaensis TaxID=67364 RepID=UPI0036E5B5A0